MADERNRMLEQLNADDWQECRQSVLIVDDSAMNRRMLTEILGGRFDTAEATSGEECLHLLEENRDGISIVLLDIHMEGMDGFAVLEEMDRQKMLEDIPVIMISSDDKVKPCAALLIWARRITSAVPLTPGWCASASAIPCGCTRNSGGSALRWKNRSGKRIRTAGSCLRC